MADGPLKRPPHIEAKIGDVVAAICHTVDGLPREEQCRTLACAAILVGEYEQALRFVRIAIEEKRASAEMKSKPEADRG